MSTCKSYFKYKAHYAPRCGCSSCWDKYFNSNMGTAIAMDSIQKKYGKDGLVSRYGTIMYQQFVRWFRTK
jgi:hypothetical protein